LYKMNQNLNTENRHQDRTGEDTPNSTYHEDTEENMNEVSVCTPSRKPHNRAAFKRSKPRAVILTVNDENANSGFKPKLSPQQHPDGFRRPKGLQSNDSMDNVARNSTDSGRVSEGLEKKALKGPVLKIEATRKASAKPGVRFQIMEVAEKAGGVVPSANNMQTPKKDSPSGLARKDKAGRTPFAATHAVNTSDEVLDTVFGTASKSPYSEYNTSMGDLLGYNYGLDDIMPEFNCQGVSDEVVSPAYPHISPLMSRSALAEVHSDIKNMSVACNIDLLGENNEFDEAGAEIVNDRSSVTNRDVDASFDILGMIQDNMELADTSNLLDGTLQADEEQLLMSLLGNTKASYVGTMTPEVTKKSTVVVASKGCPSHQAHEDDNVACENIAYLPQAEKSIESSPAEFSIPDTPVLNLVMDKEPEAPEAEENEQCSASEQPEEKAVIVSAAIVAPSVSSRPRSGSTSEVDGVSLTRPRILGRRPRAGSLGLNPPRTLTPQKQAGADQYLARKSPTALPPARSVARSPVVHDAGTPTCQQTGKATKSPCLYVEPLRAFKGDSPVPRPVRQYSTGLEVHSSAEFLPVGRRELMAVPVTAKPASQQQYILTGTAGRVPVIFNQDYANDVNDYSSSSEEYSEEESEVASEEDSEFIPAATVNESKKLLQRSTYLNVTVNQSQMNSILIDDSVIGEEATVGLSQLLPAGFFASSSRLSPATTANNLGAASRVPSYHVHVDDTDEDSEAADMDSSEDSNKATAAEVDTIEEEDVEDEEEVTLNTSMNGSVFSVATTITLDQSPGGPFDEDAESVAALAVTHRRRRKDFQDSDVKELLLTTAPAATTSTVLLFKNPTKTFLCLSANAIEVRFDPLYPAEHGGTTKSSAADNHCAFAVTPNHLQAASGADAAFTITFSPYEARPGNFTGVLKIRSPKKVS
jgi:hypothetical protein